ncbi:MAG TPA: hypothetical protein VK183_14375 [Flavobacterium sp.]|nr:hypothetical protein [Flavobacterium sp.]
MSNDFLIELKKELKASREHTTKIIAMIERELKKTNQLDMFDFESDYNTFISKANELDEAGHFRRGEFYNIPAKAEKVQWKDYFYTVIKRMGGKVRTGEIANAVIFANKDFTYNRVRQEAATKLPLLVKEGKLKITRGANKKEGNTYEVLI